MRLSSFVLSRSVLLALAAVLAASASSAQPLVERVTRADGLPSDYVLAVHQDRWGFLWFGTDAGAVRWDGTRARTFSVDDGLPHPYVKGFAETADGTLWAATNGGLARRTETGWEAVDSPLGRAPIGHITTDREGHLILTNQTLLARRETERWRTARPERGLGTGSGSVFDMGNGRLLVSGRREAAVWLLTPEAGRFRVASLPVESLTFGPGDGVLTLYPNSSPEGIGAAGSHTFVGVVNGSSDRVTRIRFDGKRLVAHAPVSIHRGVAAALWHGGELYGTGSGGLRLLDLQTGETGEYLIDSHIRAVMIDREGSLWMGTFGEGAARLVGTYLTTLADIPARRVALVGDEAWALGEGGATFVDLSAEAPVTRAIRRVGPRSVVATPDGRFRISGQASLFGAATTADLLWMLPFQNGLNRFPGFANDGNWVSGSAETADSLWLGSYGSGIRRFLKTPDGLMEIDSVSVADGLPTEAVEDVIRTSAGTWAITRRGLAHMTGGRARAMGAAEGLPSSSVFSLFESANGTHWAGTDQGLARLDLARWTAEPIHARAMEGQPVIAMFERRGVLHAVTTRALWRMEDGAAQHVDGFPLLHGDRQTVEHAVYHAPSDRLVLATRAGVALADLSALPASDLPPPPVAIVSATVDDATVDLLGTPRDAQLTDLAPGRHRVTLQAAALRFGGAARVEWRWPGEAWREAEDGRVVLSDVGAGEHEIQVRALGPGRAASQEIARLTFRVAPRWWERRAVQALLGLVGLATLVGGVRAASQRRLRARIRQLEVAERVRAERERISRDLHDHVGAEVAAILNEAEVGRLKAAAEGRDAAALREVEQRARRTMGSLREAIWALGHGAITPAALASRLAAFAETQTRHASLVATVQALGDTDRPIVPTHALALYRIGQEAIRNAVRHSGGTQLVLTVEATPQRVALIARDDGTFRGSTGDGGGYGLENMRARAEALGGSFALRDQEGTTLTVEVPHGSEA